MGDMAAQAGADNRRAVPETPLDEVLMANPAEFVPRHHETGFGILVVTAVTVLLRIRRMAGFRILALQFFPGLGFLILFRCLLVELPAILIRRRHAGNTVEYGRGDLVPGKRIATAQHADRARHQNECANFTLLRHIHTKSPRLEAVES